MGRCQAYKSLMLLLNSYLENKEKGNEREKEEMDVKEKSRGNEGGLKNCILSQQRDFITVVFITCCLAEDEPFSLGSAG